MASHMSSSSSTSGAPKEEQQYRHVFNGGKMQHIFQFSKENDGKNRYSSDFTSPQAQEALEQSQSFYWKIDGACAILLYNTKLDKVELYERFDTRGKDPNSFEKHVVALPKTTSRNLVVDAKHSYFMKKVTIDDEMPMGKKLLRIKRAQLDIVERHEETLKNLILLHHSDNADDDDDDEYPSLSVELVGTKFQQTPGVTVPVAIAPHCQQRVVPDDIMPLPRTFEEARDFLLSGKYVVEGLIIQHNDTYWKLRSNLFDPDCMFEKEKSKAMAPPCIYQ